MKNLLLHLITEKYKFITTKNIMLIIFQGYFSNL